MANEELDLLEFFPMGRNRHGFPGAFLIEDDRTLRTWALAIGTNAAGAEGPALLEDDRTPRSQLTLWDPNVAPAAPIRWRGETAGEAAISLHGSDEADNQDELRTDPDRIIWTRPHDGYLQVDPTVLTAVVAPLWTPGTTGAHLYEVSFIVVNNDAGSAAVTVTVGVDIGAAGTLGLGEYWLYDWVIPYPGDTGWQGPYIMPGNDRVMGIASAVDDTSIQFRIRRVDVGA